MNDLYLSQREARLLRFAFIVYGLSSWWTILDKHVISAIKRSRNNNASREHDTRHQRPDL
jgi:hypothetical protein